VKSFFESCLFFCGIKKATRGSSFLSLQKKADEKNLKRIAGLASNKKRQINSFDAQI
jgi:hypothetical protein